MTDRFVNRDGLRLHVVDHGGSGLPVMLVHGGSAHARWWDFVVPHLRDLHPYALDLRGHGDSDAPDEATYGIADYADDVAAVIEALGLERPALVGHSLGSFVSLRYAVDHPGGISALVVVDGRASFGPSGARYMRLLGILGPAEYDRLDEAIANFRPLPKETCATPEVLAHVARHGLRRESGCWTPKFDRRSLASHEPFDLRGRLGEIDCPVLFVRGALSAMTSAAGYAELAAACRNGRWIEIPGCHHHVLIDRPDRLGKEIRSFLRRVSGGTANGR